MKKRARGGERGRDKDALKKHSLGWEIQISRKSFFYERRNELMGFQDKIGGNDTTGCILVILRHKRILLFIQLE